MLKWINKIPCGFLTTIVTLAILYLTLAPHPIGAKIILFPHADKVVHFLMFFGFAGIVYYDFFKHIFPKRVERREGIIICLIGIFFGATIEVMQDFIGRSADVLDAIADSAGAIVAIILSASWFWKIEKKIFENN